MRARGTFGTRCAPLLIPPPTLHRLLPTRPARPAQVHTGWPLWLIAAIFIAIPSPSYIPYWAYIVVATMLLVVGAKLVSVTAMLGLQVWWVGGWGGSAVHVYRVVAWVGRLYICTACVGQGHLHQHMYAMLRPRS